MTSLVKFLDARPAEYELILVDDGSSDGTLELMRTMAAGSHAIRAIGLSVHSGKGRATATGVRASRGTVVVTTDADLSTPLEELDNLMAKLGSGADIAIASRAVRGAVIVVSQPFYRVLMGRIFNRLVQLLLLPGLQDTQCGFKAFKGDVARELFTRLRVDGFAFDVEVLLEARRRHYAIAEIPVRWLNSADSRVSPVRHSLEMFRDLLKLRLGLIPSPSPQTAAIAAEELA